MNFPSNQLEIYKSMPCRTIFHKTVLLMSAISKVSDPKASVYSYQVFFRSSKSFIYIYVHIKIYMYIYILYARICIQVLVW